MLHLLDKDQAVLLEGQLVKGAFAANAQEGVVRAYEFDTRGQLVKDGERARVVTLRGSVQIVMQSELAADEPTEKKAPTRRRAAVEGESGKAASE